MAMKRFVTCLLIAATTFIYSSEVSTTIANDRAEIIDVVSALSTVVRKSENRSPVNKHVVINEDQDVCMIDGGEEEYDPYIISDEVPLEYEEQRLLQNACEEFSVPYAMALALIEKETNFRNVKGDSGASHGYMQVQPRWNQKRMNDLNATDLMDPGDNFRVGLDILSENYGKYDEWGMALTVYNMGHNPGYVSKYARDVLSKYEKWTETISRIKNERDGQL